MGFKLSHSTHEENQCSCIIINSSQAVVQVVMAAQEQTMHPLGGMGGDKPHATVSINGLKIRIINLLCCLVHQLHNILNNILKFCAECITQSA